MRSLSFKKSFSSQPFLSLNEQVSWAVEYPYLFGFCGVQWTASCSYCKCWNTASPIFLLFYLLVKSSQCACWYSKPQSVLVPVTYKIIWLNNIIEDVVFAFRTCVYSEVSWCCQALRDRNIKCNKEKHFFSKWWKWELFILRDLM